MSSRLWTPLLLSVLVLPAGCGLKDGNFSQYPGFADYFRAHPPSSELPGPADRELLHRFRPRLMLPPGHSGLIDFYEDYIANGHLVDGEGDVVSRRVDRELLNAHKDDPRVVFVHTPGGDRPPGVVYGRVDRESLTCEVEPHPVHQRFTFLTYHAVFRVSGLPEGMASWQELALGMVGDLEDWHQLDHYTAATIVLEGDGHGSREPVAVVLQQHNGMRTYLAGEGIDVPADGRVVLDVAIRSNELYPHEPGRTPRRAVAMPDPEGMRYLLTGIDPPRFSADDVTGGEREAEYTLEFLPPNDAFYTFKGFLGERRRLPGRDGPPGADYNTLPRLKPFSMQLFVGYWRENHPGDIARFEATIGSRGDYVGFACLQGAEFYRNWQRIRGLSGGRGKAGSCALPRYSIPRNASLTSGSNWDPAMDRM